MNSVCIDSKSWTTSTTVENPMTGDSPKLISEFYNTRYNKLAEEGNTKGIYSLTKKLFWMEGKPHPNILPNQW